MKFKPLVKLDDDEIEEMVYHERNGVKKYLKNYFYSISYLFDENKYSPKTLNDASLVLNSFLELDTEDKIEVEIKGQQPLIIKKNNFYNGYASKVWKKLTLKQRAQIVKWHFNYRKKQLKYKGLNLKFIIDDDTILMWDFCGVYDDIKHIIYINPNYLDINKPIELIHTIEHELEHANQFLKSKKLKINQDKKMNVYEKFLLSGIDNLMVNIYTAIQGNYSYRASPKEMSAEKHGLKHAQTIIEQNIKDGLETKAIKDKFNKYKDFVYFENYLMPVKIAKGKYNLKGKKLTDYKNGVKTIKNADYIVKLCILRESLIDKYYENREDDIYPKKEYSADEILKIDHKLDRIDDLLKNYFETYQKNYNIKNDFFKDLNLEK